MSPVRRPRCGVGATLRMLWEGKHEPDTITYTALINAYQKAGRSDDALKIYDHMLKGSILHHYDRSGAPTPHHRRRTTDITIDYDSLR